MEGLAPTRAEVQIEVGGERKTVMIINIVDGMTKMGQEVHEEDAIEDVAKLYRTQINIAKMTKKTTNKKSVKMTQISHKDKNNLELVLRYKIKKLKKIIYL